MVFALTCHNTLKMSSINRHPCSGVILAGGLNTRFTGRDKALLEIGGKSILSRILEVFRAVFDEIILVSNNPQQHLKQDLHIVTDLIQVRSSLTGIHTGLFYSSNPYIFCSGCDTPFLKKDLVECVLERIKPGIDLLIPETSAGLEPLCAVYSKESLSAVERKLLQNKCKIHKIFKQNRIRRIPEKALRIKDPDLISFLNINTPEDLEKARHFASKKKEISA